MKPEQAKAQMTVWWVLWAAFQFGIVVIYQTLSKTASQPQPQSIDSSAWLAGFIPFAISTIIRWLILPRAQNAQTALPMFVIGIAMAEATCFLGIYLFPAHKQELFIWSAIGIFQFIPYFV